MDRSKAMVINGLWMTADGSGRRRIGGFGGRDQPSWWFSASEGLVCTALERSFKVKDLAVVKRQVFEE